MPSFEGLLLWLLLALLAAGAVALLLVLRDRRPPAVAAAALARGDFAAALAAGSAPGAPREERLAAAAGAKHLLDFDAAGALLAPLLAADPEDGEAWLEAGLVAAYAGDHDGAEHAFARAAALRSDLLESITLHRAWSALARGDRRAARARFEEVEAPLESKLRSDLGPGDPLFAEWFLQAAALWRAAGDEERAAWALAASRAAAPASRLWQVIAAPSG